MTTDETNRCLTGGSDGKCKIWDLNTVMIDKEQTQPKCLFVLDNNHTTSDGSSITSICITFDNNKCITTRKNENQCDIWDINTGVHLHTLKGHICFTDGFKCWTVDSSDGKCKKWDIEKGEYIFKENEVVLGKNLKCAMMYDLFLGPKILITDDNRLILKQGILLLLG